MWPFFLTFSILLTHAVHVESWQCYGLLKQCTTGIGAFLDIKMINPDNMNRFCENYTYSVIPCLANRMKQQPGNTHHERFLTFRKCVENDRLKHNKSRNTMNMIKILRLYLYGCIYNSMTDMLQNSCFNKLVQNCVEKTPTIHKCYYWQCKSHDFLTLKKSNINLATDDEENEDEENSNKTIVSKVKGWKTSKFSNLESANISIVQNGNYRAVNLKFAIYLVVHFNFCSFFIHSFETAL